MKHWLICIALLSALPAAAETLRCGNKLVYEGDELFKVEARCGKPAQISHSTMLKYPSIWRHGRLYRLGNEEVSVPVETWIYNFGSSRFMRKLRFEDGVLVAIETLEYGH